MNDPVIACRFSRAGPQSVFEDTAGSQYVIDDDGHHVYGL